MNTKINKNDLIIYLFKKGRSERLANTKNYPSEYFYGFLELREEGFNIKLPLLSKDKYFSLNNKFFIFNRFVL